MLSPSGPEEHVANPGFQAVKSLICGGVPVPTCYLLPEKGNFGTNTREKGLQVVN